MKVKKSLLNIGKEEFMVIEFNYPRGNLEPISIYAKDKIIIYLDRISYSVTTGSLNIIPSNKVYNKLYIISTDKLDFNFNINEDTFSSINIKANLNDFDINNLLYLLTYDEYVKGNQKRALDILSYNLKDKYLTNLVKDSFTVKERKRASEHLLSACHNRKIKLSDKWSKARMLEGRLESSKTLSSKFCIMELLNVLSEDDAKFVPLTQKEYKRIGKKIVDNYNAFKPDRENKMFSNFKDLVFTKEKLNVSIRYPISGYVTINPRLCKKVGLSTNKFKAKIYREQTIIKDAEINSNIIKALVTNKTLNYLKSLDIKDLFVIYDKNYYSLLGYTLIYINLYRLPIINSNYILKGNNLDELLEIVYTQRINECKLKVTKFFMDKLPLPSIDTGYTINQKELLESYGLDYKGIYNGIDNNISQEINSSYSYKIFDFYIKGFSTLPKVESVINKIKMLKKLNKAEVIMADYINWLENNNIIASYDDLKKLFNEQKDIILTNIRLLTEIKLIKVLTGDFWNGLELSTNGNYIYKKNEKTLVIKVLTKTIEI
ncbi:hypothetical protein SAMN02745163_01186 [Clostridium cavendishii DSM 21758]|uniref:Uncharacterized protein n=1 Tax=Clostridium cavendishii DSM 21758 TaxID=1121302 RepID=A0A1M6FN36_9CLOT|nr:hypothetical protein [Clostridium cavendishii]SHI99168.1 hypothetical protein SAMN02745163_01186 [Clostridium cavendishii DSM 21758]